MEKFGLNSGFSGENENHDRDILSKKDLIKSGLPDSENTDDNISFEGDQLGIWLGPRITKDINDRIVGGLNNVINEEPVLVEDVGLDTEEYFRKSKEISDFSDKTGNYFERLIPNGLIKPNQASDLSRRSFNNLLNSYSIINDSVGLNLDQAADLPSDKYRKLLAESLSNSVYSDKVSEYQGVVAERELSDDAVEEITKNYLKQYEGNNIICEYVENTINKDGGSSYASSYLVIKDTQTGVTLNINALIPENYFFKPHYFNLSSRENKRAGTRIKHLKDYSMKDMGDEGYVAQLTSKNVVYGDLTLKGGMLSLFHEIAHSWQSTYISESTFGKRNFEGLYKKVKKLIDDIDDLDVDYSQTTSELKKLGVEFYADTLIVQEPIDAVGVINIPGKYHGAVEYTKKMIETEKGKKIMDKGNLAFLERYLEKVEKLDGYYPLVCPALKEAMDGFVSEERDAWAHAIKTLRFLRKNGLDVEPGLRTLSDFKSFMGPYLQSYQDTIEETIQNKNMEYRFRRVENAVDDVSESGI